MTPGSLSLLALDGIPEVTAGMALAPLIVGALERHACRVTGDDVLLVCQKIVSKSEGRFVDLAAVEVSERARDLAATCGKDPRLVEVILRESTEVIRCAPQVLIVRHRLGFVMANAGVDQSNVPDSESRVLLLPENPDASAAALRGALAESLGSCARHRDHGYLWPPLARRACAVPPSVRRESRLCSIVAAKATGSGANSKSRKSRLRMESPLPRRC